MRLIIVFTNTSDTNLSSCPSRCLQKLGVAVQKQTEKKRIWTLLETGKDRLVHRRLLQLPRRVLHWRDLVFFLRYNDLNCLLYIFFFFFNFTDTLDHAFSPHFLNLQPFINNLRSNPPCAAPGYILSEGAQQKWQVIQYTRLKWWLCVALWYPKLALLSQFLHASYLHSS